MRACAAAAWQRLPCFMHLALLVIVFSHNVKMLTTSPPWLDGGSTLQDHF